jgi:hypothetical protein
VTRYHYHDSNVSGPGKVFPWQNVRFLSAVHRYARRVGATPQQRHMILAALRGKLDYALSVAGGGAYPRAVRRRGVYESLRDYPLDAWTLANLRSLGFAAYRALFQ